jgi:hypothetical protein
MQDVQQEVLHQAVLRGASEHPFKRKTLHVWDQWLPSCFQAKIHALHPQKELPP